MNKEILIVIDAICNEKNLKQDDVFDALETALATAVRRKKGHNMDIRVAMDRSDGSTEIFRRWLVIDDDDPAYEAPEYHILLTQAKEDRPEMQAGDYIEEKIEEENVNLGRISAHAAKQVIIQKVREAERFRVADFYRDKVGKLVMGVVKREEYSGIFIDLGNGAEGFIPRDQSIIRENFRIGDRVRAYLSQIDEESHGKQLVLSRTAPEFLIELFKLEVPEVGQGLIEIISAARDSGLRAKIAVRSKDPALDPVGACVGMRGSRVQAVSNELAGERVDIINWDEDLAQYVINAMAPAKIVSIIVYEEKKSIDIAVTEDKLSQAIGRGGQNIRLASQLVGWHLEVMTESDADEKAEKESQNMQTMFKERLDVDEEVAAILVQEGFSNIEEIAYIPIEDLLKIEEFDQNMVDELRSRASDVLLSMAAKGELGENQQQQDLLTVEGMDEDIAQKLIAKSITTSQLLAEQSLDDLLELVNMDRDKASLLILAARKPWFEQDKQKKKEQVKSHVTTNSKKIS